MDSQGLLHKPREIAPNGWIYLLPGCPGLATWAWASAAFEGTARSQRTPQAPVRESDGTNASGTAAADGKQGPALPLHVLLSPTHRL